MEPPVIFGSNLVCQRNMLTSSLKVIPMEVGLNYNQDLDVRGLVGRLRSGAEEGPLQDQQEQGSLHSSCLEKPH